MWEPREWEPKIENSSSSQSWECLGIALLWRRIACWNLALWSTKPGFKCQHRCQVHGCKASDGKSSRKTQEHSHSCIPKKDCIRPSHILHCIRARQFRLDVWSSQQLYRRILFYIFTEDNADRASLYSQTHSRVHDIGAKRHFSFLRCILISDPLSLAFACPAPGCEKCFSIKSNMSRHFKTHNMKEDGYYYSSRRTAPSGLKAAPLRGSFPASFNPLLGHL